MMHVEGLDRHPREIKRLVGLYLSSHADAANEYASPLVARDLSDLPPVHIMSAEYDPLRDDGEQYAKRLNELGVAAAFSLRAGHLHSSATSAKVTASARPWREEVISALPRTSDAVAATGHRALQSGRFGRRRWEQESCRGSG
jgi:acetyl esterase